MVEFYAEWAGPCRMVGPMLQELANEYEGKVVVGELNVDNNADISMKYGIRNIPAVLYFRNGEVVDRQIGAVPKRVLASKLEALLGR